MTEAPRVVGSCAACGGDLVRLAVEGEMASCACGASSIPDAVIDTARRMAPTRVRPEPRPCTVCGKPIVAAQLYVVAGPTHVFCDPPPRLDVAKVAQAARKR